ncbi:hypothetical protein [Pseudoalteromonas piratica]|uniref:Uncharacterized protein n=1 Tax=Pseudoalteromonas piratica TaxID=1348114 RepID=A0A0A7EKD1_9GAMM|nr:hypothetical protein [Pseudoalteromonas piratica]AIY67084.1 hypothetical protein OM33_18600 [Pseudoalteromonas piratica]
MRKLLLILSILSSPLFASDYNDYVVEHLKLKKYEVVRAKLEERPLYKCIYEIKNGEGLGSDVDKTPAECSNLAQDVFRDYNDDPFGAEWIFDEIVSELSCSSNDVGSDGAGVYYCVIGKRYKNPSTPEDWIYHFKTKYYDFILRMNLSKSELIKVCPPTETSPATKGPIALDNELLTQPSWCYDQADVGDPYSECPEPSPDDIQVFGTEDGFTKHCFNNPNGTQCHIETDETGGYTLPLQYASQEISACEKSKSNDSPDPDKTTDPDPLPDGEDTDNTDQTTELDALNQANDNLDVINKNINDGNVAVAERLEQNTAETQNSNEYLSSIKDSSYNSSLNSTIQNSLLEQISEKLDGIGSGDGTGSDTGDGNDDSTDEDTPPITATAERKTGGLNDFFTEEDKATLVAELEAKKLALTDVYTQIQNDVTERFNFSNSISGTYESRKISWRGHEKEVGAQRLSENLFKQLAPIVLLVCSIIALGILLWE